ncbi:MAG: nucleotidyltransferase family protein [Leptospirales bacterium]
MDITDKDKIIAMLVEHKDKVCKEFDVKDLMLFGSVARGEASGESDLDILVSFKGKATSKSYFGLQFYLEDLFECKVDLVTDKALRPELRPFIEKEAIHV